MAKISKAVIDKNVRNEVFSILGLPENPNFQKINDRTFGTLVTDANGVQRYARVAVIVAEEKDDITAAEVMNAEIAAYETKQASKAEKAAARAEKAAKDKAKREAAAKTAKEKAEAK